MSFAELLRKSRATPGAALHKFLTNYDPSQPRVYAFVEGDPDRAFYRAFIYPYLGQRQLHIYNCDGKGNVYGAYDRVIRRYPNCRNVLFFVDKDVDDIVGCSWPQDPRIFTTDAYAIENYLVCREGLDRYFADYVKMRRFSVELESLGPEFGKALANFHASIAPMMFWIIALRRSGQRVLLSDLKLSALYAVTDDGVSRTHTERRLEYLVRVTKSAPPPGIWRQVRQISKELKAIDPKRYVRGKFEAWFFVEYIKRVLAELSRVAQESTGSLSVNTPLYESNVVQLLVRGIAIPPPLRSFLEFHLSTPASPSVRPRVESGQSMARRIIRWIRRE